MPLLTLLLAAAAAAAPAAEVSWQTSADAAFAAAKQSGEPVLADFQAPWCYSCYYMEQRVLSKPGFADAARRVIPLKVDIDTDAGAALKSRHAVTFLPTYLLLSPSGKELGRIVGEQTEPDFLAKLALLTGRGAGAEDKTVAKLRAQCRAGSVAALEKLLERPADCETAYDVGFAAPAVDRLYPEHRKALLSRERKALESLAESRLLSAPETRCADFRSGLEELADVDEKLGDAPARAALLDRVLALLEKESGPAGEDRNRDDNRRFFLELKGDAPAVRAWYEKLVAAYPSDYVYAYRYAKWLEGRGEAQAALPWIERADTLSYGANRLTVTAVRARVLAALGRRDEALAAIDRDLKASSSSWTAQREELKRTRAQVKSARAPAAPDAGSARPAGAAPPPR